MSVTHRLLLLLCALLMPDVSSAQGATPLPTFGLERLRLEASGLGSLVVGTGRTLEPGAVRVSLQVQYEHAPLNFVREWDPGVNSVSLVTSKLSGVLTAAVGVLPWLQVDAQLPYILLQNGNSFLHLSPPEGHGLDTPWVTVRAAPLSMQRGAPINLAAELGAALPLGVPELLARDAWALRPSLQAGYVDTGFQVGGEVALLLRPRVDLSPFTYRPQDVIGNELRLGATVTSRGRTKSATRPELSVLINLPLQGGRASGEVLVGVRKHATKGLDLYFLAGPGLGSAVDIPAVRLLAGGSFSWGEMD